MQLKIFGLKTLKKIYKKKQVRNFIIFLVFALVGNKDDLYSEEEVSYEEGLELSKEINAIYQRTSAKNGVDGIDKLFEKIGKKLLDPSIKIENNIFKEEKKIIDKKKLKDSIKNKNKEKTCCS